MANSGGSSGRLAGKSALITGASSGIGRGIALAFAREGARVFVNHPSAETQADATLVCAEIKNNGGDAQAVQADVSDEQAVEQMVAEVLELTPIDILVNNAGIAHSANVQEIPIDMWDRLFAVHVRGAFLVSRAILPGMYERGQGCVINTASQLAYKGAPGFAHYTACKGALISFTRTVALEAAGYGVNVNAVAPGATQTPILDDVPEEVLSAIAAAIPLGRIASVDDIVPTYVMLASEDGRHYQGQCLSPNGGDVFL